MFQRFHAMREEREGGFTLIELLVVVLIIAILAAIAIPVFLRQREKAYQADLTSTLRNAATSGESYAAQNTPPGSYSGLNVTTIKAEGLRVPASQTGTFAVTPATDNQSYCVFADDNRITAGPWVNGGSFDSTTGEIEQGNTCTTTP